MIKSLGLFRANISTMDETQQLIEGCQELGLSIDEVQKQMQSFFSVMPQQIDSSFTLPQQAKIHLINAYAVSSLAYSMLSNHWNTETLKNYY